MFLRIKAGVDVALGKGEWLAKVVLRAFPLGKTYQAAISERQGCPRTGLCWVPMVALQGFSSPSAPAGSSLWSPGAELGSQ